MGLRFSKTEGAKDKYFRMGSTIACFHCFATGSTIACFHCFGTKNRLIDLVIRSH